jgi:uncharacterized protein with FMN-binding domain
MRFHFYFVLFVIFLSTDLSAQYIAGSYEGSADGQDFNELSGIVSLKVFLSPSHIDSILVIEFDQDIYHKVYGPPAIDAKTSIPQIVIARQSIDVDAVSGATISSNALLLSIARALEKGTEVKLLDGIYRGSAQGRKDSSHSGIITVSVEITNNRIANIRIDTIDQVTDHKRWGYYVEKAIKVIPETVIKRQSVDIDAVSQATNTSNSILLAISKALENALKNDFK